MGKLKIIVFLGLFLMQFLHSYPAKILFTGIQLTNEASSSDSITMKDNLSLKNELEMVTNAHVIYPKVFFNKALSLFKVEFSNELIDRNKKMQIRNKNDINLLLKNIKVVYGDEKLAEGKSPLEYELYNLEFMNELKKFITFSLNKDFENKLLSEKNTLSNISFYDDFVENITLSLPLDIDEDYKKWDALYKLLGITAKIDIKAQREKIEIEEKVQTSSKKETKSTFDSKTKKDIITKKYQINYKLHIGYFSVLKNSNIVREDEDSKKTYPTFISLKEDIGRRVNNYVFDNWKSYKTTKLSKETLRKVDSEALKTGNLIPIWIGIVSGLQFGGAGLIGLSAYANSINIVSQTSYKPSFFLTLGFISLGSLITADIFTLIGIINFFSPTLGFNSEIAMGFLAASIPLRAISFVLNIWGLTVCINTNAIVKNEVYNRNINKEKSNYIPNAIELSVTTKW